MELFEYVKFRLLPLTALFVLGVIAIIAIGSSSGGTASIGQSTLLLRPASDQVTAYAGDIDRYVDTELALMMSPRYLESEAREAGLSPQDLQDSLTALHDPGSEEVKLRVSVADPEQAVRVVNAVAQQYLRLSERRDNQARTRELEGVETQITRAQKRLNNANSTVQQATQNFLNRNPDRGAPQASSLVPQATATQVLATSRLQSLYQQRSDLQLATASSTSRSRVLRPAEFAFTLPGWGATTYFAALIGLVLLILALAGAGLALTRRVISLDRWNSATAGTGLGRAIPLRVSTESRRGETVERVRDALVTAGSSSSTSLAFLPPRTEHVHRRAEFLLEGLTAEGIETHELSSMSEFHESTGGPEGSASPLLLLVDRDRATLDDAAGVRDLSARSARQIVPVLV